MVISEIVARMPSGRTHLRIEAILLFGWTALAGYLLSIRSLSVDHVVAFVLAYAFSMLFLSPDLDLARSGASRRWGAARLIWAPYAALFRHRGLSHHPLVGPLTRILYLGLIGVLAWTVVLVVSGRPARILTPSLAILGAALAGLYLPNATHIAADRVVSAWRRGRRKRRL